MAELGLDVEDVLALEDSERRVRVPQRMKRDVAGLAIDAGPLERRVELAALQVTCMYGFSLFRESFKAAACRRAKRAFSRYAYVYLDHRST